MNEQKREARQMPTAMHGNLTLRRGRLRPPLTFPVRGDNTWRRVIYLSFITL